MTLAHGYALALPVTVGGGPSFGRSYILLVLLPFPGGGDRHGDSFGTDPDRSAHRERSDSVRPYLQQ